MNNYSNFLSCYNSQSFISPYNSLILTMQFLWFAEYSLVSFISIFLASVSYILAFYTIWLPFFLCSLMRHSMMFDIFWKAFMNVYVALTSGIGIFFHVSIPISYLKNKVGKTRFSSSLLLINILKSSHFVIPSYIF